MPGDRHAGCGERARETEQRQRCHRALVRLHFDETVRRHLRRDEPVSFTPEHMRSWYTHRDLLDIPGETVIGETNTFEQTVTTILHASGLTTVDPQTPCPRRCPHCARKSDQTATATATAC
ncbi:hypothetical protein [Micromonospora sp. CP22]|uniref:hypothetical protein n=1 Tax=Micromonospora sp. CP22 TaxID=2580517 RepID=UPI0018AD1186|nr:hypothetical protein [Micromonospora sp. CP22]